METRTSQAAVFSFFCLLIPPSSFLLHPSEVEMLVRWGLRALLLSLLLSAVGFMSNAWAIFEVLRVASAFFLTVGMVFLIIAYVRTPDPPEK